MNCSDTGKNYYYCCCCYHKFKKSKASFALGGPSGDGSDPSAAPGISPPKQLILFLKFVYYFLLLIVYCTVKYKIYISHKKTI